MHSAQFLEQNRQLPPQPRRDLTFRQLAKYRNYAQNSSMSAMALLTTSLTTPVLSRYLGSGFCMSAHTSYTALTLWFLSREIESCFFVCLYPSALLRLIT